MIQVAHDRFERLIGEHYEPLKPEVLTTVRGKLAVANLHPDASDLEAAYNAAWHALYEQSRREDTPIGNLGGWLATIAYRRAIDDIRRARLKHRVPVGTGDSTSTLGYEPDVDDELDDRRRYHQWLMSLRLRLTEREQQAVSLCVLHEYSRRDASEVMGVDVKRLDKIMVAANKKLGGMLDAINRGEWCNEQRSLIKAYAFGLHDEDGERHALAAAHVGECHACAAYVRSLRGLSGVMPAPTLLAGAGGGAPAGLGALLGGGSGGTAISGGGAAAGGGGAALLGSLGAKTAALCISAVCAAGGAVVIVESARDAERPPDSTANSHPASHRPVASAPRRVATTAPTSSAERRSGTPAKRAAPDPRSKGAQEIAELGIEPQATSTTPVDPGSRAGSVPRPPSASEFGIGP